MEFMKATLLVSLFIAICKAGAFIGIGILLLNYLEDLITLVTRRPMPTDLPEAGSANKALPIIRLIGVLLIIMGFVILILGTISVVGGFSLGQTMNLKF
jgi:hypothetical protein